MVTDDDSAIILTLADIVRRYGATAGERRSPSGEAVAPNAGALPPLAVVTLPQSGDESGIRATLQAADGPAELVVLTGRAGLERVVSLLQQNGVEPDVRPARADELLRATAEHWQQRLADDDLREVNERLRAVVESDLLGIMFWDLKGRIFDANDAFLRLVGYTREDLAAGRVNWAEMTPPEWAVRDAEKAQEIVDRGWIVPYEKEFVRKDGARVPILVGASMLPRQRDRGVGFFLDISELKRVERELRARVAQQAAVARFGERAVETNDLTALFTDGVALVARTLDVPFASVLERRADGASVTLKAGVGWDPSYIGRTFAEIDERPQAGFTMATSQPALVSNFDIEGAFPGSTRLREHGVRSGVTVPIPGPVQVYGVLAAHHREPRQFTQDDVHFLQSIAHILGTAVDRARAEAVMRQSQRMEAVGQLAGGVAHDFNNMLTAIIGYGQMLQLALPAGDPHAEHVDEILKASMRAAALTKQLLAFSRQQVLTLRPVNLNEILTQIDGMLRRLVLENIELVMLRDPNLGQARADPSQVDQIILNLCINARDAMPAGGRLTVETANVDLDAARARAQGLSATGPYVMLAVSDTGSGMDAETKARVFEPFFTTKGPDRGTGLGLATVYGIVKQSGGEIWVYSELGHGTTFKVFLPRITETAQADDRSVQAAVASLRGSETVLVAEDDKGTRRLVERLLTAAGYTVLVATNGEEALELATRHAGAIHLLVTDLIMPALGGRELVDRLKAIRPRLRALLLSGYTDDSVQRDGMVRPGERFLQKPFTGDVLLKRVRQALDAD